MTHNNPIEPTRFSIVAASRVQRLWRAAHRERYVSFAPDSRVWHYLAS
jgi:hypothetical protein